MDLVACVVHIKLFPGIVPGMCQKIGKGISQYAPTGIAHVHGSGGIGGDELHHHLAPFPLVHLTVSGALPFNGREDLPQPGGTQTKVEESGSGDLHPVKITALQLHVIHQNLCQCTGILPQCFRPRKSKGGSIVPQRGVLGNVHTAPDIPAVGKKPLLGCFFIGLPGEQCDLLPGGGDEIAHFYHPVIPFYWAGAFSSRTSSRKRLCPVTVRSSSMV